MHPDNVDPYLSGSALYGDDFDAAAIERWFSEESEGYASLGAADRTNYRYVYHALNKFHGYSHLPEKPFRHVLGLGSAWGEELLPLVGRAGRATIIDPSLSFADARIDGIPVEYRRPNVNGQIALEDETVDLAVSFGVLHHIPNVSTVIREMQRVLKPAGHVLLREPTHSMGDWRQPRRGLTKNERGIPLEVFRSILRDSGLTVLRETRCMFSLTPRLERLIGRPVWTVPWVVKADAWLCRFPWWSGRYHAESVWQKLRPIGVAYVLEKPATPVACSPTQGQVYPGGAGSSAPSTRRA